jgi:hypothetical protein
MSIKHRLTKLERDVGAEDAPPIVCSLDYETPEAYAAAVEAHKRMWPHYTGVRSIQVVYGREH